MNFGEKLSQLLLKNGYNYATEFAPKVDLSADTINQYKRKETPDGIDIMKIYRIAKELGVSMDYLLSEDDESEKLDIKDYKYINDKNISVIQVKEFVKEMKSAIMNNDVCIDNKQINEEKKYLIDSLDIGIKLLKQNT